MRHESSELRDVKEGTCFEHALWDIHYTLPLFEAMHECLLGMGRFMTVVRDRLAYEKRVSSSSRVLLLWFHITLVICCCCFSKFS